MQSATEYRALAEECLRHADHAKNDAHLMALLQQADTLLRMASEAVRMEQILQDDERKAG
jgi:hypothetical protein